MTTGRLRPEPELEPRPDHETQPDDSSRLRPLSRGVLSRGARSGGARSGRASSYDADRVTAAIRELLIGIGEDPDRPGLIDTPDRVARAYAEMFAGLARQPADVLTSVFDEGHDEIVLVKDIALYSVCEHHLLPFVGRAHVGYLPNEAGQITGLSKLARVVDLLARRPQVQERLTTQVADAIEQCLRPRGVIVVMEAEHLCMTMRGTRKPGAKTLTSAVRGAFRDSSSTRAEAMALILAP